MVTTLKIKASYKLSKVLKHSITIIFKRIWAKQQKSKLMLIKKWMRRIQKNALSKLKVLYHKCRLQTQMKWQNIKKNCETGLNKS